MVKNNFNHNLRYLRESIGLTQKEFAAVIGISPTRYSNYETTSRQPDFDILIKISDALRTPIDALIREKESPQKSTKTKKTFSSKLRSVREKNNLTQQNLGEKIGVDAGVIALWETGTIEPDLTNLLMISYTLDVSVDTLLGINRKSSDSVFDIVRMLDELDETQLESFRDFLETLTKK